MNKTDGRLFGVDATIKAEDTDHKTISKWTRAAYSAYLKQPTIDNLHDLVGHLLAYQDSVLLGKNRKAE